MVLRDLIDFRPLLLLVLYLGGCAAGPIDYEREYSEAIPATGESEIDRGVAKWEAAHPGMSGFTPLAKGMDALGARLELMDHANVPSMRSIS